MIPHQVVAGQRPAFPDGLEPLDDGLIAVGGRLAPDLLVEAYRKGIFPWTGSDPIPWYSPDPRLVVRPRDVVVSRRLARTLRQDRFEVRYDTCFEDVMRLCRRTPRWGRHGSWITPNMIRAYGELHRQGVAHSVEVFLRERLVGGVYGLALGAAFFGESMVYVERDASKVALVHLCRRLARSAFAFLDAQQVTAHLLGMGGTPIPRDRFLEELREAVSKPDRWPFPEGERLPLPRDVRGSQAD